MADEEHIQHCLVEATKEGSIAGLRYALNIVKGRRIPDLNRPSAYLAALDEIEIFLNAAIERVENGESMNACNTTA